MAEGAPGPAKVAAKGLCPRCGSRTLFERLATFAPMCRACGLDFRTFDVGDGPAAFLTLLIGALVTFIAIAVELAFRPPFWVHVLLWVPATFGAVLFSLRFAKAMLLALEYRHKAREARVSGEE